MNNEGQLIFEDGRVMEFREAVYEDIINIYDGECEEYIDEAMDGKLNGFEFNNYVAMIFGSFLGDLYTTDRKKYLELTRPLVEAYKRNKSIQDAIHKRTLMRIHNISLVKNEKTSPN